MSVKITTAAAASGDCTSWTSDSDQTGNVKCGAEPGSATRTHRAVVTCLSRYGGGVKWEIKGPWKPHGRTSSATCSHNRAAMVVSISHEFSHHG